MKNEMESYPPGPREALAALLAAVAPLSPEPAALAVYGSLAKGAYREGESDVNLVVVMERARPETLAALAGPLRAAYRAARVEPFLLTREELPRLADAFPVKLADIIDSHHMIHGEDPFGEVVIEPEHLRLRVEQELRNHLLRLRRRMVFGDDDARAMGRTVFESTTSLFLELGALLRVLGQPLPAGAAMRDVARASAAACDLDLPLMETLVRIKEGAAIDDPRQLVAGLLRLLDRAVEIVDAAGPS